MSKYAHFTIYPDSLSCLKPVHCRNIYHPYILDILYRYYYVSNQGKVFNFCWILSHIGIHGDNEADKAANFPFDFEIVKFKIPSTDFFLHLFFYIHLIILCPSDGTLIVVNCCPVSS